MDAMKQVTNVSSIGPIGLMWVVIVAMKLMAVIDWSWWIVVFFPVIAGIGITVFFGALLLLVGGAVWAFGGGNY